MSDSETIEGRLLTAAQALAWWGALIGGALLFLHFYTIKYLPTFDLTSLMGTIAAVAVLGVLLFVMLFVLLVLPGLALIAGDLLGVVQPLPSIKQGQRFNEAESAQALSLLRAWAVGSAIGLIALASCILADAPLGVFYGLFSWAPGVWAALVVVALWKNICPLAKKPWGMAIFSYLTFTYFAGVSFVSLHKLGTTDGGQPSIGTILGIVLAIYAGQFVVYASKGLPFKLRGALVCAVGAALLLGTSLSSIYTQSIGRHFRFGQMSRVEPVVTARGCGILRAAGTGVGCAPDAHAQDAFLVGPVDIWTRIGKDTLLSKPGGLTPRDRPRTLLPNSEILSVSMADEEHIARREAAKTN